MAGISPPTSIFSYFIEKVPIAEFALILKETRFMCVFTWDENTSHLFDAFITNGVFHRDKILYQMIFSSTRATIQKANGFRIWNSASLAI